VLGGLGLAQGWGAFGEDRGDEPVLSTGTRDWAHDNAWIWPVLAVAGVVIAYLGWRWLKAQLRTQPTVSVVELHPRENADPAAGDYVATTRIRGGAVTSVVEDDVTSHPRVSGARARLADTTEPFRLDLDVTVHDGTDLSDVRRHLAETVLPRLRQALELEQLDTEVRFEVTGPLKTRQLA
jgi:hypothetical protein